MLLIILFLAIAAALLFASAGIIAFATIPIGGSGGIGPYSLGMGLLALIQFGLAMQVAGSERSGSLEWLMNAAVLPTLAGVLFVVSVLRYRRELLHDREHGPLPELRMLRLRYEEEEKCA